MPRFARCVFAVFLAVSCLSSSLACQAAAPETAAAAFILMEAGSGRVLASRNETQERSIASTTAETALASTPDPDDLRHDAQSDLVRGLRPDGDPDRHA